MKECPVCKESFQDDLNFCDLDGTPLDGGVAGTVAGSSSKLWSFLGVALLLAAVGITAGAILFFPRGPSATLPVGRSQSGTTASAPASTAPDAGRSHADPATGLDRSTPTSNDVEATASASADQTRLASRKTALSKNDNSDPSLPNPKAVVGSDDDLTKTAKQSDDNTRPRTANSSTPPDSRAAKVAATDPSGSDSSATAPAAAKRRSRTQAQGDDAAANGNRKDDKKKGGFLRVFKKIFGHN
jgi:hypothetical protein